MSHFQHLSVEDAKRMQGTDSAHLASIIHTHTHTHTHILYHSLALFRSMDMISRTY